MIAELIIAGASFFHPHAQQDSLGIETVNGKIYVIHKVDEKETLYAISKRYGSSVDAIVQTNPGLGSSLEVGQILKVPYTAKTTVSRTSNSNTHKVEPKETMFSISKAYNVTIDELKQWNNLTDNSLSVGQELIIKKDKPSQNTAANTTIKSSTSTEVAKIPANGMHTVEAKETLYSIARHYNIAVQQIRDWNKLESDELKVGQTISVSAPKSQVAVTEPKVVKEIPKEVPKQTTTPAETAKPPVENTTATTTTTPAPKTASQTIKISEAVKNSDEIMESGVAELIDGTEGNRKYLALHRTAPVGTILKVRNEMNNREVFVRVMGKLPDTALTDKLVIRISKSAYDRLGAMDPRFRVEVTYYK
jgi:LysM repeat protein